MNLFFFGSSDSPLFGAYHPAETQSSRAALICQPLGHEYMRSHWCVRQLARRLEQGGVHVMRFDYRGTGDSGGAVSVDGWRRDLVDAGRELRDTSGARELTVIGMRFGATLAAVEASNLGADRLVLWDPVVSGRDYVDRLTAMHREALRDPDRFDRPRDVRAGELLGYDWPQSLADAIARLSLPAAGSRAPVDVVASAGESSRALAGQFDDLGVACTYHEVDDDCRWSRAASLEDQLLAPAVVTTIAEIVCP